MPDLFPDRDLAAASAPAREPALTPAAPAATALAPTTLAAEHAPYRALFVDVFDRAYDRPGEPGRGARVRTDVEAEARTFGDEWTVQSVAAERFGAATQPGLNTWLAGELRTEAGQEAILHARKPGAATPDRALGNDLVVLLDREAAVGFGHIGVLIGDDSTGWRLYSKDGSAGTNPGWGPTTWTNNTGPGQTSGPRFATFATLDDFFSTPRMADKYEAAVRVEVDGNNTASGNRARSAVEAILGESYQVRRSSCATAVVAALEGAGVAGFSITESLARNPFNGESILDARKAPIYPKSVFSQIKRAEGGDDRVSPAQRAWEARSADSEPGS